MFRQAPLPGLGTRAVGPTLVALLLASPVFAQTVFNRIPTFTSVCYSDQDRYWPEVDQLKETLQAEAEAGEGINSQLTASVDLSQQQQRVMAAMQSNPQRAMEVMQLAQALPIEANEFLMASVEREQAFDEEAAALLDEYRLTLERRTASIDAQIVPLSSPGGNQPANYMDLLRGLYGQWDAEYAIHCAEWFGPTGRYGVFLDGLQSYLLEEWVPASKRLFDRANETEAFLGGVDASRFVFAGEHEAAIRYLDTAYPFLSWRQTTR
jgi:hypothetical protein